MSRTTRTRTATALTGLALTAGAVLATGSAAYAADFPTDRVKLLGAEVDFGRNWNTSNAPLNGGYLFWSLTDGEVEADLEGYLYMKNAAGDCAKVEIEYHDDDHNVLATDESPLYCTESNGKVQFFINEEERDQFTTHVVIRLWEDNGSDGSFSLVDSGTWHIDE